jgi:hypothetical protein
MPPSPERFAREPFRDSTEAFQRPASVPSFREIALKQLHGRETFEAFRRRSDLERGYCRIADEAEKALPLFEGIELWEGRAWAGTLRSAIKELKGEPSYTLGAVSARITVDADTASARSELAEAVRTLNGLFEQLAKVDGHPSRKLLEDIGRLMNSTDGLSAKLEELREARADLDDFSFRTVAKDGIKRFRRDLDLTSREGRSMDERPMPFRRVDDQWGLGSRM